MEELREEEKKQFAKQKEILEHSLETLRSQMEQLLQEK